MSRILVPIAGNANDRFALQDVIRRFMNDTALEVHLLHVQAPFSADIARFTSGDVSASNSSSRLSFSRVRAARNSSPRRPGWHMNSVTPSGR